MMTLSIDNMKKKLSSFIMLIVGVMFYTSCQKSEDKPRITLPLVVFDVNKGTIQSGSETIQTGPLKDFEQGSDVVYKLTVSSGSALTRFFVSSTSDVISNLSKVIKTEPENAIDANGKFTRQMNDVVVYYAYRIDPGVGAASSVGLTFSFQNEENYVGTSSDNFRVIKTGSTAGKLLNVVDLPYLRRDAYGIGTQDNFSIVSGIRGENNVRLQYRRAPFYSIDLRTDLGWIADEVVQNAEKVDFVGYRPRFTGTNPVLVKDGFYLVSPDNTVVLTTSYAGAATMSVTLVGSSGTVNITAAGITSLLTFRTNINTTASDYVNAQKTAFAAKGLNLTVNGAGITWTTVTPGVQYPVPVIQPLTGNLSANPLVGAGNNPLSDIKIAQLRDAVNSMVLAGKNLKKVYFKRLDNLTGTGRVTPAYFDALSHDNEFDALLGGVVADNKTFAGPISYNEVYGFVMADGRRGLIKTTTNSVIRPDGTTAAVDAPNANDVVLYCTIKIQQK